MKNSVSKFLKICNSIYKELADAKKSVSEDQKFWTGEFSHDVKPEDCKPYKTSKWLKICNRPINGGANSRNGYDVDCIFFWQTYPVYMKGTSQEVIDNLLNKSDRKKILFSENGLDFGYSADEYFYPTESYYGLRLESPAYTVWKGDEVLFKSHREIELKQWFEGYFNPVEEKEPETFEDALLELGIKVSVINHDRNKKIGGFLPLENKPEWVKEEDCFIVKISFPNQNKVEFSDREYEFGKGVKIQRSSDKIVEDRYSWINNVVVENENSDIHHFIKMKDAWYKEEVVWFFTWGNTKPSVKQIITDLFSDFEMLETEFVTDGRMKDDITLNWNDWDSMKKLHVALGLESIDISKADDTFTFWRRFAKIYNRLKNGDDGWGTMSNDGLGYKKFTELREIVDNWN